MKVYKKIFAAVLSMAVIVGLMSFALADGNESESASDAFTSYVEALDKNDWSSLISLSVSDDYEMLTAFYNSEENAENSVGFHAVTSASLASLIEIDSNDLYKYTNAEYYFNKYGDLKVLLAGVYLKVDLETKYTYNGLNFFLVTLAHEDDGWKDVLLSAAPASLIEEKVQTGQNTNDYSMTSYDEDVEKALNIIYARYHGIILDGEGNVIDTNIASPEDLAREKGL